MINKQEHVSLLPYNTFGIDVKADCLIEYGTPAELKEVLRSADVQNRELLVVGGGSNLLFLSDFRGTVIRSCYRFVSVLQEDDDNVRVEVGAGVTWDDFVVYCVEHGWYGAENLSLIPGQVGAAAVQNIGAYGVEVKDIVHEVHALHVPTGEERVFGNEVCRYGYRASVFKGEWRGQYIVTSVVFDLGKRPSFCFDYQHLESAVRAKGNVTLQNVRNTIVEMRQGKLPDPKLLGNAGSFFKNPVVDKAVFAALAAEYPDLSHFYVSETAEKISAAWLIDRCGWKGKRLGAAGVYDRQPLVLVNLGHATGADIRHLAEQIQRSVYEKFGINLQPEVNYIGR